MKVIFILSTYYLIGCFFSSCTTRTSESQTIPNIPYPQPLPDSIAIPFLPNIVSTDEVDFNAAFSSDGKSFYFSRSKNKQSTIYATTYDGRTWTAPTFVPTIETGHSEADPALGPDGKLYFISNRPKDKSDTLADYDIWFITPLTNGRWSAPENLTSVNSDSSEFYISFSENGNLYFASSRKGGFGEEDLYVSRLINNQYTVPENLGKDINSEKSEYDPFIFSKEDFIVFTSSNREYTFGGADLYCSKLTSTKKWLKAVNLGKNFNTKTREYCAYLSPDSKYFFFSSEGDVKWMDAQFLKNKMDRLLKIRQSY